MRYTEAKDRSAELLRLALGRMGAQAAALNPHTYAVWYEVVAGINPPLQQAVAALVDAGSAVDDEAVQRLLKAHVTPPDDEMLERVGHQMQGLMAGLAQTATQTGDRAGAFGAQLGDLAAALKAQDTSQLSPRLVELLEGAAAMRDAVSALQGRLRADQQEIERLRGDLERARGEALLDPLTGILNRKGFDRLLQGLLADPHDAGRSHGLVMLDIDHFKKVNDTHGHLVGDRVIQAVGQVLRTSLRSAAHAAARYGGEEFALLLPDTAPEDCLALAEEVRQRTRAMRIRSRHTHEVVLTVSVSGGVTTLRPGDDAPTLLARVDAALYASKHGGRDRLTRA